MEIKLLIFVYCSFVVKQEMMIIYFVGKRWKIRKPLNLSSESTYLLIFSLIMEKCRCKELKELPFDAFISTRYVVLTKY